MAKILHREIASLLLRILLGFVVVIVVQAGVIVMHAAGWYPERLLAEYVMLSPSISLSIGFAIVAVLLWLALDYLFYRRNRTTHRPSGAIQSPVAGTTGILNLGRGNTFVDIETIGFDHGVVDQGENALWVRHRSSDGPAFRRPYYDKWDSRNEFRLIDLAWLWEDLEPAGYSMPHNVRTRFDRLAKASDDQQLVLIHSVATDDVVRDAIDYVNSGGVGNPNWTCAKQDAIVYAKEVGERPLFLFPRERVFGRRRQVDTETILNTILRPPWIIHHNPSRPTAKKAISFNADGLIGEGGNNMEYKWAIRDGMLEIRQKNGSLQNYFWYDQTRDQFFCTNSQGAAGHDNVTIFRPGTEMP